MPYFLVSFDLRGCYADDSSGVVFARTRRELRAALASEASDIRDAGYIGANKRAVSRLAALAWRHRRNVGELPFVLPVGQQPKSRAFGLFVSAISRHDAREFGR